MKSICIVVNKYPNSIEPNVCVFIQQLVWSFANLGIKCNVICPLPMNLNFKYLKFSNRSIEYNEDGRPITIYHPKYLSLGQKEGILQKQRVKVTTAMYMMAVDKVLKTMKEKTDVLYGHFICPSGVSVAALGEKYNIPSFFAHGEAIYSGNQKYGNNVLAEKLKTVAGVIAVSSQNKDYLINAKVVSSEKINVFPNGFRPERFYKRERVESRKKFNIPKDAFIVGMCGSFDERKGILRLQNAVDQIPEAYFVCAGKGEQMPTSDKCLFAKQVNNEDLPWFYSALDVFVLPTQNEGCCNATVEAIACGCPIVSSDKSFNYDICDETNSILIDPNNIDEIKNAIITLRDSYDLREKLAKGSQEKAKKLTLEQRANNIIEWINKYSNKDEVDNR